jgi:hypothetical protein
VAVVALEAQDDDGGLAICLPLLVGGEDDESSLLKVTSAYGSICALCLLVQLLSQREALFL